MWLWNAFSVLLFFLWIPVKMGSFAQASRACPMGCKPLDVHSVATTLGPAGPAVMYRVYVCVCDLVLHISEKYRAAST